jgi:hypothetical protein
MKILNILKVVFAIVGAVVVVFAIVRGVRAGTGVMEEVKGLFSLS